MRLSVTLPKPPSLNNLFCNAGRRGRVKSKPYTAWIADAGYCLNMQTAAAERIDSPVSISITVDKGRGDLANYEKALVDLLVRHRLLADDDQVYRLVMQHDTAMGKNARVIVEPVIE